MCITQEVKLYWTRGSLISFSSGIVSVDVVTLEETPSLADTAFPLPVTFSPPQAE